MIYVFSDYALDTTRYELRRNGQPLQVAPKVFDLLVHLIQRHGQFISKEALFEHLWPNQFVSESALAYCVTEARKAIGDTGRAQRIIKTVYGRGYRFIAPVQEYSVGSTHEACPVALTPPLEESLPEAPSVLSVQTRQALGREQEAAHSDQPLAFASSPAEAERRQLTVMQCRLLMPPELSAGLDPEDLHAAIQRAHNAGVDIVHRFEGSIAQHYHDGFMAHFGYPRAHEDNACRAVRTGLQLVQEIDRLNEGRERERDVQLAVCVGIHTGMVVMDTVRSGTRREPLALGDTPHVALLLSGIAAPNTVVVSSATLTLIEGYFVCQALGSHILEDLPQLLVVHQVLQESGAHSRLAAVTIGLTPFIGRREEVGLLRERWQQVQQGMGRVVLLSGEAGIGKSRLMHVLQERMAGERRIECRCSAYYQNSALYPVVEHVQQGLGWSRDDTPQEKVGKLAEALQPSSFALEEAVPLLATLLSLPCPAHYAPLSLTPQRQKQKTLEVLLSLLLQEAERQPVCFVMEDLHWADPLTLEWLGLLIDRVHTARMLVLLAFRPDFRPPWAMRSHVTHIALSRLTPSQIERMIKRITRGKALPAEVLQQLVVKSEGVPLFVEEMTRMVLESGLVKENDGQYELMGPLTPLAIPSTLHDSLMARLDRLGTGKQVAQLGATLGREFSYEVMRAIAPLHEETLQYELTQLVDAELLHQRGFLPQAQYSFRHVLVQEAAYQSLLRSTRRRYHKQIAQALEERFPETRESRPELLAHHYTRAGLQAQAIVYWQHAARRSLERSAHADAIAHVQQGLTALASLSDSPERQRHELTLQIMLGAALAFTRGYGAPEVVRVYARAREICEQVGDTPQLFTVLRGLWLSYLGRSELPTAGELGAHLLRLAQSRNDPTLLLEAHRAVATSLFFMGEQTAVVPHLERCLIFYGGQPTRASRLQYGQYTDVMFLLYKAWNFWLRGYPDQALHTVHQMIQLSQQHADVYSRSHALTLAAVLHQWRQETEAVHERLEASLALADDHVFPFPQALGTTVQGWVLAQQGRRDEGIAQIRRGIAAYRSMDLELFSTYMLALLAEVYRQAGNIEEGLHTLAEALTSAHMHGERWWEAELYRLQAELLLLQATPNVTQAETALQQALAVARDQQVKSLELRTTMSLCRLWQQQRKCYQAHDMLREIYDWFTEGHDTADLREARMLLDALA